MLSTDGALELLISIASPAFLIKYGVISEQAAKTKSSNVTEVAVKLVYSAHPKCRLT